MKNAVIIKSYQNGISLHLDDKMDFELLLVEIAKKFKESEHFFKDVKVALSFEGRVLNDLEENQIIDVIGRNSSLSVVCVIGKNEKNNHMFLKALKKLSECEMENMGRFYKGPVKNEQTIESESSIVILGDVYPGSCVISAKDIIVFGGLYGEAHAGENGEEGCFIAALEMSPEKLSICNLRYKPTEKPKWSLKPKMQPKIAYVKEKSITIDPVAKEVWERLI